MFYHIFIIVFSIVLLCSQSSHAIVNGTDVSPSQRPEIVRLLLFKGNPEQGFTENGRCSGTAISDSLVLTAGHCVVASNNTKNDVVVLHRLKENGEKEIIPAEDFYTNYIYEDLQIIKDEQNKNAVVPGCSPGKKPLIETKT